MTSQELRETQELFPIVEKQNDHLSLCGFGTPDWIHTHGIRHLTVQVIPTALTEAGDDCMIFTHWRESKQRVCPSQRDFNGGHVDFNEQLFPRLYWESPVVLEKATLETAIRESLEEVRLEPPIAFTEKDLHRFLEVGSFECETLRPDKSSRNCEYSTAFVLGLPPGHTVTIWEREQLSIEKMTFCDLLSQFQENPHEFADGASRILKAISKTPAMQEELYNLILHAAKTAAGVKSVPFGHTHGFVRERHVR